MTLNKGDLIKVTKPGHSCYGRTGVFLEEFTVPNATLEKPLYKVLINDEIRMMLLRELEKI
jgi:hypothetical protein